MGAAAEDELMDGDVDEATSSTAELAIALVGCEVTVIVLVIILMTVTHSTPQAPSNPSLAFMALAAISPLEGRNPPTGAPVGVG